MAVEWTEPHKRVTEYRFLPEHITIKPDLNGRVVLPPIDALVADILKRGQSTPVVLRNDGGASVLVAGFSRWRAIKHINDNNLAGAPVYLRCTFMKLNEGEAFVINITENAIRNPTTPEDDAHNIKALMNRFAYTEEDVASVYKPLAKTPEEIKAACKWVRDTLALVDLTQESADAIRAGRVKPTAVQALAKLSSDQQHEALKKDGEISKSDVAPKKTAPVSTEPKPATPVIRPDPELLRRIDKLYEDVTGIIDAEGFAEPYVEVEVKLIRALRSYRETFRK